MHTERPRFELSVRVRYECLSFEQSSSTKCHYVLIGETNARARIGWREAPRTELNKALFFAF